MASRLTNDARVLHAITVRAMLQTRQTLLRNLKVRPDHELCHIQAEGTTKFKEMLSCDRDAEANCKEHLLSYARREGIAIKVLGEESLWDTSTTIRKKDPYVILLDMVDGSDLLERYLGNWCSAAVIFHPSQGRILSSFVQDANNNMYTATERGAWFQEAKTQFFEVEGDPCCTIELSRAAVLKRPCRPFVPLRPTEEDNRYASICFYAQKTGNFIQLPDIFRAWLRKFGFKGRLYTLAGNPMMVKLANGERIHVVFDYVGQFAHDAIPGLYIALKAGASVVGLDGVGISESALAQLLYTPAREHAVKYVLASNEALAKEIAGALTSVDGPFTYRCRQHDSPHNCLGVSVRTVHTEGEPDRLQYFCGLCDLELEVVKEPF